MKDAFLSSIFVFTLLLVFSVIFPQIGTTQIREEADLDIEEVKEQLKAIGSKKVLLIEDENERLAYIAYLYYKAVLGF